MDMDGRTRRRVGTDFAVNSLLHCVAFKEVTFAGGFRSSAILHPCLGGAAAGRRLTRNGDTKPTTSLLRVKLKFARRRTTALKVCINFLRDYDQRTK